MADFAELLNLNPERVRRVGEARLGYARALAEQRVGSSDADTDEVDDLPMWAAGEYVRGASLLALCDIERAREGFASAAELFRETGRRSWVTLDLAAGRRLSRDVVQGGWLSDDPSRKQPDFADTLAAYDPDPDWGEIDPRTLSAVREAANSAPPVSRFEVPLRAVVRSLDEANGRSPAPNSTWSERYRDTFACLERMNEPYSVAMRDRFHWQRLQSSVLPVEPEFLAYGVALARLMGRSDRSLERLRVEVSERAPAMAVMLDVAGEILSP